MRARTLPIACGYVCAAAWLVAPAAGQTRQIFATRGSEGASTRVGIVGSYNTYFDPFSTSLSSPYAGNYAYANIPRFRAGMARPLGAAPRALLPSQPALVPARGRYATLGKVDSDALRDISGLGHATSMFNSPRGWIPADFLKLSGPPVLPDVNRSVYHQFFWLEPAVQQPAKGAELQAEVSTAELYEGLHETDVNMMTDRAIRAFREATQTEVADRIERLSQAQDALTSILYINPRAQAPALLCVYIALEREQLNFAMNKLFQAAGRNPDMFREKPDLARYFGDPKLLSAQLRKFAVVDEARQQDAATLVIQAYCAWMLDDVPRVRRALDAAAKAAEGEALAPAIELLSNAMKAGMPNL